MENLPHYQMVLDATDPTLGLSAISLVHDPAIEVGAVFFSKEDDVVLTEDFKFSFNEDQMRMTGPVMVVGKKIGRKNLLGRGPATVSITAEQVQMTADKFMRDGLQRSLTLQHDSPLNLGTVVEQVIVRDEAMAKSMGYPGLEPGSLIHTVQFDKESTDARQFWASEIKTGNVTGYSLEGRFKMVLAKTEKTNMSKEKNKGFFAKAIDATKAAALKMAVQFGYQPAAEAVEFERVQLVDQSVIDVTDDVARSVNEAGELGDFLAPGKYTLLDGTEFEVGEEGKVLVPGTEAAAATVDPVAMAKEAVEAAKVEFEAEKAALEAEKISLSTELENAKNELMETKAAAEKAAADLALANERIAALEATPAGTKAPVTMSKEKESAPNPKAKNAYHRMFGGGN